MNKLELKNIISEEKLIYLGKTSKNIIPMIKSKHKRYYIFKYLYYFRYCQFYHNKRICKGVSRIERVFSKYMFRFYDRKKNVYSYKAGVEIGLDCCIGRCCNIWHSGVVINGNIGDYCVFHGNNIIGNKGYGKEDLRPEIGNFVDVGAGAIVIGDVMIADRCKVGAGAVVTKSFSVLESTIIGVPGHTI